HANRVLDNPAHPYTELLLDSIPRVGKKWDEDVAPIDLDSKEYSMEGCKFAARCVYAKEVCKTTKPDMLNLSQDHQVLCFKHNDSKPMNQFNQNEKLDVPKSNDSKISV